MCSLQRRPRGQEGEARAEPPSVNRLWVHRSGLSSSSPPPPLGDSLAETRSLLSGQTSHREAERDQERLFREGSHSRALGAVALPLCLGRASWEVVPWALAARACLGPFSLSSSWTESGLHPGISRPAQGLHFPAPPSARTGQWQREDDGKSLPETNKLFIKTTVKHKGR